MLGIDVVDAVDEFALTCLVVVPEEAVLEISAPLAACDLLVDDWDGQDGAYGAGGVGSHVLLAYCHGGVTCFGVGGDAACGVGVCVGDALVGK